jgi:hypothetical protein
MSDKKTHTIQLGNAPKEEVTAAELEAVKQATGPRFTQYDVQLLQPETPPDLTAAPRASRAAATAAAQTTEEAK